MSSTGSGYDQSVGTFSPDGRIYQVEYSYKAIESAGTALGVKCSDGVILGVEKLVLSKMLVEGSGRRVHAVDEHVGAATAGLNPDGRMLVERARDEARGYRQNYGEPIPPNILSDRMGSFMHLFTLYGSYRPVGSSILLAGYSPETKECELYMSEPTGLAMRYFGAAIGKGSRAAKTEIEKHKFRTKTCEEALPLVAKILLGVHDALKDKPMTVELGWVRAGAGGKYETVSRAKTEEAMTAAKALIQAEEDAADMEEEE